jgi:ABC-type ATPase with predicted acetyltransferase domain
VLLRELTRCVPAAQAFDLATVALPDDRTVVDCFEGDAFSALQTLSVAGLSDVFSILNRPARLSAGQQYRFRLAQALASGRPFVFADEFCSELDPITACTVAFNVQRFARQAGTTLVLASARDDILMDLAPDAVVTKYFHEPATVVYRDWRRGR